MLGEAERWRKKRWREIERCRERYAKNDTERERWAHTYMQLHMYGKTDGHKEGRKSERHGTGNA